MLTPRVRSPRMPQVQPLAQLARTDSSTAKPSPKEKPRQFRYRQRELEPRVRALQMPQMRPPMRPITPPPPSRRGGTIGELSRPSPGLLQMSHLLIRGVPRLSGWRST